MDNSPHLDWLEGAFFYRLQDPGFLLLQDEDRETFLQRQTTNDVRLLEQQPAIISVLTSATAHVFDVLTGFRTQDEGGNPSLGVITLPGRAARTLAFLQSRIFFMDRVRVTNLSQRYAQIDLDGAQAESCLQSLGMNSSASGSVHQSYEGHSVFVLPAPGVTRFATRLVIPAAVIDSLVNRLSGFGARLISHSDYDILRVEAGVPGADTELVEAYTPLEVGLAAFIADNKGCYTGQEVIARQITYHKVRRKMVGLSFTQPIEAGTPLKSGNTPAGTVTSAVISPRLGPIGLGVLRSPYDEPGTHLDIEGQPAARATTIPLPFITKR